MDDFLFSPAPHQGSGSDQAIVDLDYGLSDRNTTAQDDLLLIHHLASVDKHEPGVTIQGVEANSKLLRVASATAADDGSDPVVDSSTMASASQISVSTTQTTSSGPLLSWGATVTKIIDGDTFEVTWDAGDEPPAGLLNRVRIAGVDTNETSFNESFSLEAKARLAELLPIGTHVRLEAQDPNSQTLNRPVRHVFVGTTNVAEVLVREGLGLAVSYDFEPAYRDDYFDASEYAQINKIGMWLPGASGGDPATWPTIEMIVNYDAGGDDALNLNDEYIQIRNNGPQVLDLSNWTARSSARLDAATIKIPFGAIVNPGETYRIYVGQGLSTANSMYLGLSEPLFDNTGDVVYLRDVNLNIRATQLWPADLTRGPEQSIVIDDVQYDAPGDDNVNPNGEWVKIRNAGAVTVDLTDWRLKDDGFDYAFKPGETLAPGQQLTIYIGKGTDSGTDRYWGQSTGILNNDGQKLHIWTPQSQQVDTFAWGTETSVDENPRGAIRMFANYDAAGNDTKNPNGEWVSLLNTSAGTIDIGGYTLKYADKVYTFAAGTKLDADANMLVRVGKGTDTATTKYWGNTGAIMANTKGAVDLINPTGETLLRHEWPLPYSGVTDYGLVIDKVNYDAPGNDGKNPNGEWLTIRNSSLAEQNLRNWQIQVGTNQLNSLADRALAPGETITVYMGEGKNTANTLYWGKTAGIMNNGGSTPIKLLTPNREVVEYHGWGVAAANPQQSVSAAIDMSINYDAVGDDAANPNGEWVNLVNTSSSTVSLDGYHLYTDGSTYVFDKDDVLAAGERMRVYRGTGTDSGLDRYSNLADFANEGDEVELRANNGGVADVFAYPATGLIPTRGQFDIVDVNYDAPGDDATNPNGEWILLKNIGSTAADLRDWRLQYQTATFFDFNGSVSVAAGATVKVFMGSGVNTSTELYWGNASGILSNAAGSVTLQSQYRETVETFTWPNKNGGAADRSIVIDDVQYDAPGDDNTNPNGEWIKVRNAGATTVDLTGWRIRDEIEDYRFATGETLAPGQQLTIYVGKGTDSGTDRYWGQSTGLLNNAGQKLHIWTPDLVEVDTFAWGTETSVDENPRGAIRMFANYDAAGNDTKNPNGEWVSLLNTSAGTIDIGGYTLKYADKVYTFAAGTKLDADANMLVRVGKGTDTATTKYWGNTGAIMSNTKGAVDLINTSGQTLLRHAWPLPYSGVTDYGLVIDKVNYDAPGDDATNPNGEWLTIRNSSLAEQNLRNWQIQVGTNQLNSFADRALAPGEIITVYMGKGTSTANTLYWGKTAGIIADDGSTPIKLLTPNREVVEYHGWGVAAANPQQSVAAAIDMSINYDAVGDDAANPNGEWVNLVNTSSSTVSLDGYHLYTDGTTYVFDKDDVLAAGERMRVYRGTGVDSGLDRYSNLNEFSNTGDEVELRANNGGVADVFAYPATGLIPTRGQFDIVDVNYDAPGNDATNPNGEWIAIKNIGTSTADLRDWRLQYQTATFFDFNGSVSVAAGATVKVFMGSGVNTNSEVYWGNAAGILSNSAGSVTLQSQYRETVETFTWPNKGGGTSTSNQSIVIDDVQYDAPGDDSTNPNGEWIKVRNAGATTVDLTGWRIRDEIEDYRFATGETLAPGQQLTIYVGQGADSGTDRYWGMTSGLLNNSGQKLHIWNPDLVEVDTFAWGTETSTNEDPRGAIRMFANYDAAGNDTTNPNGEWVSLWNSSAGTIDIGGYTLKYADKVYTFAAGTQLDADANMLVMVGKGTDTATTKYWGNTGGIMSNTKGAVDLVNASGVTLLRHEWPLPYSGVTDYGLVIDRVNYDAPGDDATNPNGEWLTIRNSSAAEQNLRNWQILVGTTQLNIVEDRPVAPGETITVYMGTGTDTANTLYWGKTAGIIADDGSTPIQLLAPNREVTQYHGWGVAGTNAKQSVAAAIDMSINYDAVGDDAANPNGEWVNLVNTSSSTVSLDGYHLYTDGTTYVFDKDDVLAAGERMRVYRGTGTDSGLDRYSNLNEFSNTADEVELRANNGGAVDVFAYPATGLIPARGDFDIVGVNYDAPGNDATNPNGEWIDIKNVGSASADLRDWRLQYQTATFFDFNTSMIVSAGSTVRIYIGSGTNTLNELYWGNAGGILSNTSGTLLLQSQYRESVDTYKWP
ncbi:MAG: lamin tail domain-containing protein [Rhizobiaceae bacterium]|nr:lamin tail domain-containing protein [Rhizobiaceae bacterium]